MTGELDYDASELYYIPLSEWCLLEIALIKDVAAIQMNKTTVDIFHPYARSMLIKEKMKQQVTLKVRIKLQWAKWACFHGRKWGQLEQHWETARRWEVMMKTGGVLERLRENYVLVHSDRAVTRTGGTWQKETEVVSRSSEPQEIPPEAVSLQRRCIWSN